MRAWHRLAISSSALTRVIEPTGGPGAELATLEDASYFIGLMKPCGARRDRIGILRPSYC
jgi:hypothetical protein